MFVCVCRAVTTRQIQQQVAQGSDSLRDLSDKLGVGSECGRCCSSAKQVIRESRQQNPQTR
ncbi:(2Fe-2S)-binding protein [Motiliproteus sp. SC1-56]|uniref:(2Fe-2S)-binding protein n=1 Tax=Motiliproteus sp. SC1-56 TaxID=2799565 RepID=UPI001A8CA838|nr:(2Fe-2S)-binding protein [Motiliproteus sp. SC1-56]